MAQTIEGFTTSADLFPSALIPAPIPEDCIIAIALEGDDTVTGGSLEDLIFGNPGNDSIVGENGADTIYGGQNEDSISGGAGDDLLIGNLANDTIDGGAGNNLIFGGGGDDNITGGSENDTIYAGQDNDTVVGGGGSDQLLGNLGDDSIDGGAGNDEIIGGQDNDTIIGGAGVDTLLGGLGDDVLIIAAGDDAAGETYDGGDGNNTLMTSGTDLSDDTLANLDTFDVATGATLTLSQENLTDAGVTAITGAGIIQADMGTLNLTGITVDSTITVLDSMGNPVGPGPMPMANFTLTTEQDTITINPPTVGMSANNIIEAPVVFNPGGTALLATLQSIDTIDATASTGDTLRATFDGAAAVGVTTTPTLSGVETLTITALVDHTLNAVSSTGIETLVSNNSSANLAVTNLQEIPTASSITYMNSSGSLDVTVASSLLSGAADEITIELVNANGVGQRIAVAPNSGNNGFEVFNVVSNGGGVNRIGSIADNAPPMGATVAGSATTVNITGTQDLTIEGIDPFAAAENPLPQTVTTIDASGLSGNIQVGSEANGNLGTSGGTNLTYTGAEGDDYVIFGASLDQNDVVDGNTGANTVVTDPNAPGGALDLTNVQTFVIDETAGDAGSIFSFADSDSSITSIVLRDSGVNNAVMINQINSLPSVEFEGLGTNANQVLDTLTLTPTATVTTGTMDTLEVSINNDGIALTGASFFDFGGLTANQIERFNLDVEDGNVDLSLMAGILVPQSPGNIQSSTIQQLTVTSDDSVALGNITNGTATQTITTINAGGVMGRFDAMSDSLTSNATVTLSAGGGTFDADLSNPDGMFFPGTAIGVIINGGVGADTITGSMDDDIITGAAGADQFILRNNGLLINASTDTIVDFLPVSQQDVLAFSVGSFGVGAVGGVVIVGVGGSANANSVIVASDAAILAAAATMATRFAYAFDTGNVYFDSDGDFDFTDGVFGGTELIAIAAATAAEIGAMGANLTATDFAFVA
jgi:hypothetical protein